MRIKCLKTGCDVFCNGLAYHGDLVACERTLYLTGVSAGCVKCARECERVDLRVEEIAQLTYGGFMVFVLGRVLTFSREFWELQVDWNFEYIHLFESGKEIKDYTTCDSCGGAFRFGDLNSEIYDGVRKEVCDECFTEINQKNGDNE